MGEDVKFLRVQNTDGGRCEVSKGYRIQMGEDVKFKGYRILAEAISSFEGYIIQMGEDVKFRLHSVSGSVMTLGTPNMSPVFY